MLMMNTAEEIDDPRLTDDHLLQLELKIARRADELAHTRRLICDDAADRRNWLEAEREVFGTSAPAAPG